MRWPSKKLGEICDITIGRTPSRNNMGYWGIGYNWVSISDMKSKFIETTKEQITARAVDECGCRLIPANTLLLSFKLSIGKLSFTTKPIFTNEAIAALSIIDETILHKDYLYYALQIVNLLKDTDKAVKGATLNKKKLDIIPIPLPSLLVQKRIAAVLDKADRLRRLRKAAIEKLDQLTQSVFLDMFGDPVTNPKGWEVKKLKNLGDIITGNTPSRKIPGYYGDYIEWIKSDNINTNSNYLTKAAEYLSKDGKKVGRIAPQNSILVTCIAGSKSCIGNAAIANRAVAFNQQINAIVPSPRVNLYFLYMHFITGKKLIQDASTGGMKGLVSKSRFENIVFICPPLTEQNRFENIFKTNETIKANMEISLNKINDNFNSLLQRAFKGELAFNDQYFEQLEKETGEIQ